MSGDFPRYTARSVEAQIDAVLAAWGMPEDKRRITAGIMVETDLRGIDSHGISMLIMYEQMQRAGQVRFDAEPAIVRQTATTALVDGNAEAEQPRGEQAAVFGIMGLLQLAIVALAERGDGGNLTEGGGSDEQVLLQDLDAAQQIVG